jgi:ubiquinol-cytochrome c reductase cytochrome c1 subunit
MKKNLLFLLMLLAIPVAAFAAEEGGPPLDKAPINIDDKLSLQRGARIFVNYCLNCHSAEAMRYNRLEDLGLTEAQIKNNLLFAADKVGEPMTVGMRKLDAKKWLGAPPPDLSVEARARGSDWIYTYLRGFYRDPSRPTGWNNLVFDKVGMPHVLYQLQGTQVLVTDKEKDAEGKEVETRKLVLEKPGLMTIPEYDAMVGDLVNYLTWMSEPTKSFRMHVGIIVILFLVFMLIPAYYLKKEFWKDVH